ncbi:MAG: flagellar hook assembly protein FlgD [Xanthomonadaceae bacterium]|nr:flagellar hook assembly protein FlgD [Xanthomonadaceae bacterium]
MSIGSVTTARAGAVVTGDSVAPSTNEPGLDKNQAPKFQKVWSDIQAKMGVKPQAPREIKKKLDKDDFMMIMINQMKYQDPTKPFDAEKMATEMAQITSMEQMQNMNKTLEKMTANQNPSQRLEMTSLIGKTVILDRNRFPHTEGSNSSVSFTLPEASDVTRVTLINAESGEPVFTRDLGMQEAGAVGFTWDGMRNNGIPSKSGNYVVRVDAATAQGKVIPTKMQGEARIIGVSFDGGEPSFLVGDAKMQQKVPMSNILKVQESVSGEPQSGSVRSANTALPFSQQNQVIQNPGSAPKPSIQYTAEKPEKLFQHSSNVLPYTGAAEGKEVPIDQQILAALNAPSGLPSDQVKAHQKLAFNAEMNRPGGMDGFTSGAAPVTGKGFPNGLSTMKDEIQKQSGGERQ